MFLFDKVIATVALSTLFPNSHDRYLKKARPRTGRLFPPMRHRTDSRTVSMRSMTIIPADVLPGTLPSRDPP